MAGPHEIALGIASVLGKPGLPDPLVLSFHGQSLNSAAEIVRAIVSECSDADVQIEKMELDPELHRHIIEGGYGREVQLLSNHQLTGEIRVFARSG